MELTGLVFLFICLPVGYLAQRFAPEKLRNAVLLLLSALFIAWGSPRDLALILLSALFNYFTARELAALRQMGKSAYARAVFASGVIFNLALLVFFKYTGFALGVFGANAAWLPAAPLGISFYTFSAVSFLTDVYRGDEEAPVSFLDLALYLTCFAKFVSGPIVPYKAFAPQLRGRAEAPEEGFFRFTVGLAKKLVLADTLAAAFGQISAMELSSVTVLDAWLGVLLYAFTLYFDFSGYSDMAIGLARVSGFTFDENFNYPYCADSVTAFWRRWHISLGMWFRNYVYIPLGGSRAGQAKTVRNIIIVWLLTGLWHGANWTFLIWGAYHAALLLAEKFVFADFKKKLPVPVNTALTFFVVVLGWVPFFAPGAGYAGGYLLRLIGIGGAGLSSPAALYLLRENVVWLALAFAGGTPLIKKAALAVKESKARVPLEIAAAALLLALSVAAAVSGTYQTFLYAQF